MLAILIADSTPSGYEDFAAALRCQGYEIRHVANVADIPTPAPADWPALLLCEAPPVDSQQYIAKVHTARANAPVLWYGTQVHAHTLAASAALQALLADQTATIHNQAWQDVLAASRAIAAECDPQQLLEQSCRAAVALIGAEYAAIGLLDQSSESIKPAAYASAQPGAHAPFDIFAAPSGVLSQPLAQGWASRVSVLDGDPQTLGLAPEHAPVFSLLAVPLGTAAQLYGTLYLANKQAAPVFGAHDQQVALALAAQAALAYENCTRGLLLQRHQAQSERSAREFQEFLYSASHDLQEPLRKVEGFGALLDKQYGEALAGDGSDYLQRMRAATQRMQRMLDALLVLSRVATQARPFTRVDLSSIARDACAELAGAISDCGARVTSADLPVIEADGEQLRKLFWHVLDNALKFRRVGEAPVICVTARLLLAAPAEADGPAAGQATECCELAFADNGIGFEARYSERIFAPFQRLHGRGAYAGSGLGLAICRRIVQRHGGTITATGVPGAGTTVRVVLPIAQPGEPAQTRAMQPTH